MFLRSIVINLFLGRELMNESAGVCGCGAGAQYLFVTPQVSPAPAPPPPPAHPPPSLDSTVSLHFLQVLPKILSTEPSPDTDVRTKSCGFFV